MASVNAVEVTRDMLAYTLTNDKQSLIKLLKRNGIEIPSGASDKDVTIAVLLASGKSAVFKSELANLLASKIDEVNAGYQSFAGGQFDIGTQEDKTMFTGSEDFFPMAGLSNPAFSAGLQGAAKKIQEQKASEAAQKQPKEKGKIWSWLGENVFNKENINAGLNMGLTALNNKIQSKQNAIQAESEYIVQRQEQQIQQQQQKGGMGVGTVILIVVGVGLLGAMVYYFTKK